MFPIGYHGYDIVMVIGHVVKMTSAMTITTFPVGRGGYNYTLI